MIAEIAFPIPLHRTFYYRLPAALEVSAAPGLRVLVPFGFRQAAGVIVKLLKDSEADLSGFREVKSVIKLLDASPVFTDDIVELAFWMRDRWNSPVGLSLEAFFGGRLADLYAFEDILRPTENQVLVDSPPISGFSAEAVARIGGAIGPSASENAQQGGASLSLPKVFLLTHPPGILRNEIFIPLCARAMSSGGQVLLMVPDLNVIASFAKTLSGIFGEPNIALWHSHLTPVQRKNTWTGVLSGRHRLLVGMRSAAFLPFRKLALAIVDSEHDNVYKQEEEKNKLHFHARELLLRRARSHGTCVTLASPCPSLETYGRAVAGDFELVAPVAWTHGETVGSQAEDASEKTGIGRGIGKAPAASYSALTTALPAPLSAVAGQAGVSVIDMNKYAGLIAEPLADKIKLTLERGRKVLLLTGRKGYTGLIFCVKCGWTKRCARCRVPMSVVKEEAAGVEQFLCRRCGRKDPYSEICPRCSGTIFRRSGLGTQKAEEAAKALFPAARTARFDGDVVRKSARNARETLEGFLKGGTEILVGTRIAARDRGLETLGLVAVLDADIEISSTDFRASEKAFQLFYEAYHSLKVSGAELAVQTREPGHYVLSLLKEMDYQKFLNSELQTRKDFFYPPFSFLVKVSFASFDLKALQDFEAVFLKELDFLSEAGSEGAGSEILGPVGAADPKKRKFFSQYYLVKAANEKISADCLEKLRSLTPPKKVKMTVIADPYGFR
ncbi:MAG TPA: primosomal protein N' [Elusimicrobia bacterium]|nr:primosomal protein N' [Elusimicrobiota bacterium]